jgi:DNA-binding ferritin-like protein
LKSTNDHVPGSLSLKLGVDDASLARRREFVRLGDKERQLLIELIPWSVKVAQPLVKDFYDWQFGFPPTRTFFEHYATSEQTPLNGLRQHLEAAQRGYYQGVFEGARQNWGGDYFERRLYVGWLHDKINLPFKWYIGAYAELQSLSRAYLRKSFSAVKVAEAEEAIGRVFNYDMQAVGDSFLLASLEAIGLDLESIEHPPGMDRTEFFAQVKASTSIMLRQAEALAEMRLSDPIFHNQTRHLAGNAFDRVRIRLSTMLEATTSMVAKLSESAQSVSTATEEMTSSISEIAKNSAESARVASSAVALAETTNTIVGTLGESSAKIGQVVKVITTIAQQTNLLALNATIEAARAGAAGKGFAVVANEVKELAKATAKATEDIGHRIEAIQTDATNAVEAIGKIGAVIDRISDISNSIASAVEEQTAVTNEIARGTNEAARLSSEVSASLMSVADGKKKTTANGPHNSQPRANNGRPSSLEMQKSEFKVRP